jgi:hypothetical protein
LNTWIPWYQYERLITNEKYGVAEAALAAHVLASYVFTPRGYLSKGASTLTSDTKRLISRRLWAAVKSNPTLIYYWWFKNTNNQ